MNIVTLNVQMFELFLFSNFSSASSSFPLPLLSVVVFRHLLGTIKPVSSSAFCHLHNIAEGQHFLSQRDAEILIHAFISSRLHYCNSLLSGCPNNLLKVLARTRKRDRISPVWASLRWLCASRFKNPPSSIRLLMVAFILKWADNSSSTEQRCCTLKTQVYVARFPRVVHGGGQSLQLSGLNTALSYAAGCSYNVPTPPPLYPSILFFWLFLHSGSWGGLESIRL